MQLRVSAVGRFVGPIKQDLLARLDDRISLGDRTFHKITQSELEGELYKNTNTSSMQMGENMWASTSYKKMATSNLYSTSISRP